MARVRQWKAAGLAAVLRQPSTTLLCALRQLPVDDVWELLSSRDSRLPEHVHARFSKLDLGTLVADTERCGARVISPGDAEWPAALDDLGASAPWVLWARGRSIAGGVGTAIVGSRSCTSYGARMSADLAIGIGGLGYRIISGGALGIDASAHRGALSAHAHTVAVLACGVDVAYPAAHHALFERIVHEGTLISESPPGEHPTRAAFLIRNRIIAALAQGTVVVEARVRSGALSTARHAADLNRMVMGVPGPVGSAESAGVHELIKHGAQLVTSAADVVSLLEPIGTVDGEVPVASMTEWDLLSSSERQVYETFPAKGSVRLAEIRVQLDVELTTPALLGALTSLQQRGLVSEAPDGSWHRVRKPRGAVA